MSLFPIAKKVSRPSILVFLTALVLAWAAGSPAAAGEPVPSPVAPDFEALLFSDAECDTDTAALPELFPPAQPKTGNCSPLCGYVQCRGMLVGEACTKSTGAPGTCYGPPLGKQCVDGLPMCVCA